MEGKGKRSSKSKPSRPGPPASSVNALIRQLVAQIDSVASLPPQSRRQDPATERVLADTEVDGVRCILVRRSEAPAPRLSLSPREQEIARLVAKGYPNKMIASVLDISCWTVGTYLRRMFAKVGVCSRAALVASLAESDHLLKVGENPPTASHEPLSPVCDPDAAGIKPGPKQLSTLRGVCRNTNGI
jgi:DNA-binding CsgD family transcriptional regulator